MGEKWIQDVESYTIVVSPQDAGKPLGLELYSPTFNLADYVDGRRAAGYFGDELYKKNEPFDTTFTLVGPGGTVAERRYGQNREHTWDSLFAGGLGAGTYTLRVNSRGDGKNSYALRVASPFALETSDFTVNARSNTPEPLLAARLNVLPDWVGKTVSILNYDIDGPKEAETFVIQPGNKRADLTPSDNGKTAVDRFTITPEMVGEWQIFIRVLPTTKQYSNSVRYSFRLGDQPVTARVGASIHPPERRSTTSCWWTWWTRRASRFRARRTRWSAPAGCGLSCRPATCRSVPASCRAPATSSRPPRCATSRASPRSASWPGPRKDSWRWTPWHSTAISAFP
ncbi:hypothetical protein [Deinococcus radiopugnans]|uniref:hypothetical protein n=1 Tax=Deinococcus radiopugnans TaxID=57497 RepID=UPI0036D2237B